MKDEVRYIIENSGARSVFAGEEQAPQVLEDEGEKETCRDLVDFLIPIGKGYVTDRALEVCNMAGQSCQ